MSDFNIFLTEEVKQQLREREEAEKRQAAMSRYAGVGRTGSMGPMSALASENAAGQMQPTQGVSQIEPWRFSLTQGMTLNNLYREGKAITYDLARWILSDSLNRVWDEYDPVKQMPISDTKKHAYLSCLGAQDGIVPATIMDVLGSLKEGKDTVVKSFSPDQVKRYNGHMGIFKDSFKDLQNNRIGRSYGMNHPENEACKFFLK